MVPLVRWPSPQLIVAVKSLALPLGSRSLKVATTPVNDTPAKGLTVTGALAVPCAPLTIGRPLAIATGSAKAQSSVTTRLVPVAVRLSVAPGVTVVPSNLKITSVPRVSTTRVTTGLLNRAPTKTGWPVPPTGANSVSSRVLPLKYWMLVVSGCSTLTKMAPKPREAAATTVLLVALGTTNLKSMPLSLNMANVLGELKAGNSPVVLGLAPTKPSLLTA